MDQACFTDVTYPIELIIRKEVQDAERTKRQMYSPPQSGLLWLVYYESIVIAND